MVQCDMAEIELFFSLPLEINQIGLMVVFFGISLSLLRQYSREQRQSCMTCMMAKAKPGSQRRKRPSSQCCRDILCCFLCLYQCYLLQKLIIILNNCLLPIFKPRLLGQFHSFLLKSQMECSYMGYKKVVSCVNNCPLLRKIWAACLVSQTGRAHHEAAVCATDRVSQYTFLATGRLP